MFTLNFVIGILETSETKLVINNKTAWNLGVSFFEFILVGFGLYSLFGNLLG